MNSVPSLSRPWKNTPAFLTASVTQTVNGARLASPHSVHRGIDLRQAEKGLCVVICSLGYSAASGAKVAPLQWGGLGSDQHDPEGDTPKPGSP